MAGTHGIECIKEVRTDNIAYEIVVGFSRVVLPMIFLSVALLYNVYHKLSLGGNLQ